MRISFVWFGLVWFGWNKLVQLLIRSRDSGSRTVRSLRAMFCVGHCYDSLTGNPPRGLQFILGTNSTPDVVDTIVMANLVCYYSVHFLSVLM